ncbi:MAG TPA: universal stress protein, partial [Polyangiaceae bacterium]
LRYVVEVRADLVVVGTHGRTGLGHAVLGSVAERVARLAPCDVIVAKSREVREHLAEVLGRRLPT